MTVIGWEGPAVMRSPWTFEALTGSMSPREFCSICWGRIPLYIRRRSREFYQNLITREEVDSYLTADGAFARPKTIFMRGNGLDGRDELPKTLGDVRDGLRRGLSLQIRKLQDVLDPSVSVLSLARNMELALGRPLVSLGCYISPAGGAGLGPHHDETEVFTLQVAGRKRWRLFRQIPAPDPDIPDDIPDPSTLGPPAHDLLLEAGDALYHPRGWIHDVVTEDVESFSVVIVFQPGPSARD